MQPQIIQLAIVRSIGHEIDPASYNCQELGLAKALTSYGVSTTLFIAGRQKKVQEHVIYIYGETQVTIVELPYIKMLGWQCYMPVLISQMQQRRFDLIQVQEHNFLMSLLTLRYASRRGIPAILCQGMYRDYQATVPRLLQIIYDLAFGRLIRRYTKACIAKTNAASQYLQSKKFSNISVCPIGLDLAPLCAPENTDWRRYFGIPTTAKMLLYVGILEPRRNPLFLIQVVKALIEIGEDVYLLMVGTGPDHEKCMQAIDDPVLSSRVILAGKIPQSKLPSLYATSDVFLLASDYEIYGMVFMEAMLFGLPVVTNASAGSMQIIADGETGYIIPALNVEQWRDRIRRLLSDKQLHASFSKTSEKRIKEEFVWNKAVQKFHQVYLDTLQDHGK